MRYDKLVRDKIPDLARARGKNPVTHVASVGELKTRLAAKLYEEVREFEHSWTLEELADIVEVCHRLAEVVGYSPEQLELERQKKAEENGGFSKNIILDEA